METPSAAHFIYIPVAMLLGIVIGWVLGARAAKDAYMSELRRREQRTQNKEQRTAK
jgi:membrane protein YqaA with SNARE-associated domain